MGVFRPVLYLFALMLLILNGCAKGPSVSAMVAQKSQTSDIQATGMLIVNPVVGGKETNPMLFPSIDNESFREAIYQSLLRQRLFQEIALTGPGDYSLHAEIISQEVKPGLDTAATLMVRYELFDGATDSMIWAENIFSQHEALFSEAFNGTTRAKLANEGVARKNIARLLEHLATYLRTQNR